jgi:hypothetical protein
MKANSRIHLSSRFLAECGPSGVGGMGPSFFFNGKIIVKSHGMEIAALRWAKLNC